MIAVGSAPGSKLLALAVVVRGRAGRLELQREIDVADLLPVAPWIPTLECRWVRGVPSEISGRVFRRDPGPERYA